MFVIEINYLDDGNKRDLNGQRLQLTRLTYFFDLFLSFEVEIDNLKTIRGNKETNIYFDRNTKNTITEKCYDLPGSIISKNSL